MTKPDTEFLSHNFMTIEITLRQLCQEKSNKKSFLKNPNFTKESGFILCEAGSRFGRNFFFPVITKVTFICWI